MKKNNYVLFACLFLISNVFSQTFTKMDSIHILQSPYNSFVKIAASKSTLSFLISGKQNYLYNYNYHFKKLDSIELKNLEFPLYISNEQQTQILDVSKSYIRIGLDTIKREMSYQTIKLSKKPSYNSILSNNYSDFLLNTYDYYNNNRIYDRYRIVDLLHHKIRNINVGNQIVLNYNSNNLVAINNDNIYMALPKSMQILVFDNRLKIVDTIKLAIHATQKEFDFMSDSIIKFNKTTPKSLIDFMSSHNIDNMEQIYNVLLYKEHYLFIIIKNPICKDNCKRIVIYDLISKKNEKDFYEEQISNNFWLSSNTEIIADSIFIDYTGDLVFPDSLGSFLINFYSFNNANIDTSLVPSKIAFEEKTFLDTISKEDIIYKSKSPEKFLDINTIKKKLVAYNNSINLDSTINYKGIIFINELVCKDCFEKFDFKDYLVVFKDLPNKEYRKIYISYYTPYFKNGTYVFNENTFITKEMYNKIYSFSE